MDSRSVKTAGKGGCCGIDAGKRVPGRERHVVVATLGLVWAVVVHSVAVQNRDGALAVPAKLLPLRRCRLQLIWADGAYTGRLVQLLDR